MAQQIGEDTKVTLDLKTIGMAVTGLGVLISMWFALQADIAEAKELPIPPPQDVSRMEFDMKDKNIRLSIENTEKAVDDLKDRLIRIEDKLDRR